MKTVYFDFALPCCFTTLEYYGKEAYYLVGSVSEGFHTFMAGGKYIIIVSGEFNNTAFGYVPVLNRRL